MLTPPDGFGDRAVAAAVRAGWGLRVDDVAYAAVGFGSHHWHAEAGGVRWFVTVDEVDNASRLRAALQTAKTLRDAGLAFVVAPEPTTTGDVLRVVDGRFAVAVYPRVEGTPGEWGPYPSAAARAAVLARLVAVHARPVPGAPVDDFTIPHAEALDDAGGSWGDGPYGEAAAALFASRREEVDRVLARYARLARAVGLRTDRFVVTHGEPHPGNTITTGDGVVLVDWDTAMVAAPERDLWLLAEDDPSVLADYAAATGVDPDPGALELHRLRWWLADVAVDASALRRPHHPSADTEARWASLQRALTAPPT